MRPAYEVLAYSNSDRPDLMAWVRDGALLARPLLSLHATNRQKGSNRVRLFGWSCKALWGRRFNTERWRLFRGNGVANQPRSKRRGC
jgi:hypothetical protein